VKVKTNLTFTIFFRGTGEVNMYIYMIRCRDDTLYTGVTSDIKKRLRQHMGLIQGGAKYTHSRGVKKTEVLWYTDSSSAALKLECALKKLTRAKKEELIRKPQLVGEMFSDKLGEHTYTVVGTEEISDVLTLRSL